MLITYLFISVGARPIGYPLRVVQVTEDAPTLQELSIFYYGTTRFWSQIAQWNEISSPYALKVGQRIDLHIEPTLSKEEGKRVLLEMWRTRLTKRVSGGGNESQGSFFESSTVQPAPVVSLIPEVAHPSPAAPLEWQWQIASPLPLASPLVKESPLPPVEQVVDPEGGVGAPPSSVSTQAALPSSNFSPIVVVSEPSPRPGLDEILAAEALARASRAEAEMSGADHLAKAEELILNKAGFEAIFDQLAKSEN